jgi:hypothetical protein
MKLLTRNTNQPGQRTENRDPSSQVDEEYECLRPTKGGLARSDGRAAIGALIGSVLWTIGSALRLDGRDRSS